ncbi:MAG TPA: hypothetical protein VH079_07155 [Terriglobales bacterium]|nr:hypothetical protein [Terriglobales bacterium]
MLPRKFSYLLTLLAALLLVSSWGVAQSVEEVTFKFDFPGSEPEHYIVSVSSDGHASYDSNGKLTLQSDAGEPFHLDFTISPATRTRIFDFAQKAHYFEGKIDSGKKNIANTGAKVLIYKNGEKNTEATYNFSPLPAVQDLTSLFQQLSTTLEFGRRLEYYRHYQKTALDEELKHMEQQSSENDLEELAAVAPILRQIATDPSLMNVVRARAQRLLALPVK